MTREEAIKIIQNEYKCVDRECDIEKSCGKCPYMIPTKEPILQAYEMAIQALSQEPCTDTVSIRKDILKCRVGKIVAYNVEWLKKHWQMEMDIVCGVKPCDDAISREDAIEALNTINGTAELDKAFEVIENLPPVTQKSGKWIRWREEIQRGTHYTENIPHCKCSECNKEYDTHMSQFINFCPNCGAKMVEPQEREEQTE